MASIKVKYRPSYATNREGAIFYQVIHERETCAIRSEYRIFAEEWDGKRVKIDSSVDDGRNRILQTIAAGIRRDVERLRRIVHRLENVNPVYSVSIIAEEYERCRKEGTLFAFMDSLIRQMKQNGRLRTAETYTATRRNISKFLKNQDLMLDCLTGELMEKYESWNLGRGVSANTVSFYNRILRAVYNRGVARGYTDDAAPFRNVYTGVAKTVKRALPMTVIRRLNALDLSGQPQLDYARDLFLLSFMFRGMSFIDMAYLGKNALQHGYLRYRRRKTGQLLTIKWTSEMQKIVDKYPSDGSQYLLPIIHSPEENTRSAYRNANYIINRRLKLIGKMIESPIPLTLYVARHSWATAAKDAGVPLSVISEGMGHDSEMTTMIYLASLDTLAVDNANEMILESLHNCSARK